MTRICIVFRGENLRTKRGLTSALDCVGNWRETIFDVVDCDVVFFTYPSAILDRLVEELRPIHVRTDGYNSQESNALAAMDWMVENKDKYDRFVLLRFDVMYRKKITEWRHWNDKGITLVNRDIHYPTIRLYHDIAFVVDKQWIDHFRNAFVADGRSIRICLHHIGTYLEEIPGFPLHLMYQDYYHMTNHPFYSLCHVEPRPNINDRYEGEKILDLSPWNPPAPTPVIPRPTRRSLPRIPASVLRSNAILSRQNQINNKRKR